MMFALGLRLGGWRPLCPPRPERDRGHDLPFFGEHRDHADGGGDG